jgi:hypothetical protein
LDHLSDTEKFEERSSYRFLPNDIANFTASQIGDVEYIHDLFAKRGDMGGRDVEI